MVDSALAGVGENVGRRTLLDCLPSHPLSPPTEGRWRARALQPPFARKTALFAPFNPFHSHGRVTGRRVRRQGYRYTLLTYRYYTPRLEPPKRGSSDRKSPRNAATLLSATRSFGYRVAGSKGTSQLGKFASVANSVGNFRRVGR